jgi:hypothetical protein
MVGQSMTAEAASLRMDAALVDWVAATKRESIKVHDKSGEHIY